MTDAERQLSFDDLRSLAAAEQELPLSAWYALPLLPEQARKLAAAAQSSLQQAIANNQSRQAAQVLLWIASFWLKGDAQMQYDNLLATAVTTRDKALVELIQGQLLSSVKRAGAQSVLQRGFHLAAEFLSSEDYLLLMKRHELLAYLPVTNRAMKPMVLDDLLVEAQVIKRLRKGHHKSPEKTRSHFDTLD